jgi:hypothetical protein
MSLAYLHMPTTAQSILKKAFQRAAPSDAHIPLENFAPRQILLSRGAIFKSDARWEYIFQIFEEHENDSKINNILDL